MKIKRTIVTVLITAIITASVSVAAVTLSAKEIGFTSNDSEWAVTNVEDAVNDLYGSCKSYDTIDEDISKSLSLSMTSGVAKLYKLNNVVRLSVSGNTSTNISKDSSTIIGKITDSRYFPKGTVQDNGMGAAAGYLGIKVDANGNIYAQQAINSGNWATFEILWIASGL